MRDEIHTTRRTVCKTIASLGLAGAALTGAAAASAVDSEEKRTALETVDRDALEAAVDRRGSRDPEEVAVALPDRFELHEGVVDRIVDGRHVVILLQDEDGVYDELVEPREELPDVEEGDRLLVVLEDDELAFVVRCPSSDGAGR
ncbi:hypothetical protein [Halovivax sp.]|uniref:hypothetical protein n=1 Tax=Halovivax sp. TaxID=1935978 RepID=UPI0025BA54B6|nr:hypothetical protein [Halovivax sp.]